MRGSEGIGAWLSEQWWKGKEGKGSGQKMRDN
jgi:hypothetical protein